ncbi:C40 family peptidase [Nocardia sp. NBC_01009]|uniref:C40 family peptidase n=1 Tax=Nocardia sp. NBC_01009 TaxID=2975996 RepID=UPI00386465E6|nr:DUF4226 domain-containing protein [Nocardia sp. NBC_01009]
MVEKAMPAAMMAGTMAMSALPMIASALAGLLGGGGGGGGGGAAPVAETPTGQLSPESQHALEVLHKLAKVYGDGETTDPEIKALRKELGVTPSSKTGTGKTSGSVKARRLYQRTAATAFNNLDNQLLNYVTKIAGTNKVDKKAVIGLIREVNVALAELGPQAYTKQGQQKVRQILTAALQKAQTIVSGGNTNATDTANAINELSKQYIYNLAGKNYTPVAGSAGGSAAAQRAIQVALAQTGKPYVLGDEGPNSFDCSGLMQYAAAAAGVQLPRVSQDQYRLLPQVNPADIQPGDLIFPADSFESSGLPGHVIMYIGNGQCIAASNPRVPIGTVPLPNNFRATRWTQ